MFVLGNTTLCCISKWIIKKFEFYSVFYSIVCGYIVCTVYAMIVSIFMRVNIEANILLILLTIFAGVISRRHLYNLFRNIINISKTEKILMALLIFLVFGFMLTISGTPILIFSSGDTGYYHAQAVHWIEAYGLVPGLANLNLRFGVNNSNFCLAALFGMYEVLGVSLRGTGTYLYGVYFIKVLYDLFHIKQHRYYVGDAVGILSLIYFLYRSVFADAYIPDILVTFMIFIAIIAYCELVNKNDKELFYYGLVCLIIVYSATIKLNAAPLGVSIVIMIAILIKHKRYSDIYKYVLLGLFIVVPWLVRNVLISGYLLFPITSIDLFDFDWKVPAYSVNYLRSTFNNFAKAQYYMGGITYDEAAKIPLRQWFPGMIRYFFSSFSFEKLTGIMFIISLLCCAISFIVQALMLAKKKKINYTWIPLKFSLTVAFIFCLLSGPDSRFLSYSVFSIPAVFIFQYIDTDNQIVRNKFSRFFNKKKTIYAVVVAVLFLCYLCKGEIASNICYLRWHDYTKFVINPGYVYSDAKPDQYTSRLPEACILKEDAYEVYLLDGILPIFYQTTNTSNHFAFYDPFPALYLKECFDSQYGERVHCRGNSLTDGFYGEFIGVD